MPNAKLVVDLDRAIFAWQAKHNERMTFARLAKEAGLQVIAIHRFKSEHAKLLNLDILGSICRVLECEPGDILRFKTEQNS